MAVANPASSAVTARPSTMMVSSTSIRVSPASVKRVPFPGVTPLPPRDGSPDEALRPAHRSTPTNIASSPAPFMVTVRVCGVADAPCWASTMSEPVFSAECSTRRGPTWRRSAGRSMGQRAAKLYSLPGSDRSSSGVWSAGIGGSRRCWRRSRRSKSFRTGQRSRCCTEPTNRGWTGRPSIRCCPLTRHLRSRGSSRWRPDQRSSSLEYWSNRRYRRPPSSADRAPARRGCRYRSRCYRGTPRYYCPKGCSRSGLSGGEVTRR